MKKWEEILKCELDKEIVGSKELYCHQLLFIKIKCKVCAKYEEIIFRVKGFLNSWKNGTTSVKKDSLEKHAKGKGVLKRCSEIMQQFYGRISMPK